MICGSCFKEVSSTSGCPCPKTYFTGEKVCLWEKGIGIHYKNLFIDAQHFKNNTLVLTIYDGKTMEILEREKA